MIDNKRTSIIILLHNQLPYTKRCLNLLVHTQGLDEVILVDNGSSDCTSEFLHTFQRNYCGHLDFKIVCNSTNIGGSQGRNQGVEVCTGQLLIFLDNDTYTLNSDWLSFLIDVLVEKPDLGVVGPMLVFPPNGTVIQSAGGGMTFGGHFGLLGRGQSVAESRFNYKKMVAWVPTACMACHRETFEKVGGFDESLDPFSIGEDIDFCMRVQSQGLQICYEPKVKIYHYEGTTFNNSFLSKHKKQVFIKHMRLIRERWREEIKAGILSSEEDIRYLDVRKDYRNINFPRIMVVSGSLGSFANHQDGEWLL